MLLFILHVVLLCTLSSALSPVIIANTTTGIQEDVFAIPSKISAVCKNSTEPNVNVKTGQVLNGSSCDYLVCPKGYRCEEANDTNPFARFVVYCNEKYSEFFDDAADGPNGEAPLPSRSYPGPLWAHHCEPIRAECASRDSNFSCLATTQGAAKCCRTESWTLKTKKHCPFGTSVKNASGREQACGRFFRNTVKDPMECPPRFEWIERENTSYCCPAPDVPTIVLVFEDLFNASCLGAHNDLTLRACFDEYIPTSRNFSRDGKFLELKISEKARTLTSEENVLNVTAWFNLSAFYALHEKMCSKFIELARCVQSVDARGCGGVQSFRSFVADIIKLICNKPNFENLLDVMECFVETTKKKKVALSRCANAFAEEVDEDVSFGSEYIFRSMCANVGTFAECA